MHGRSRDAAYWRHRIERDHPEIAARLDSGEIASVRAAAVVAGLIREPSGLMQLRRAWRRAGPEERAAFMAEVGVAELVPQARRPKRKRGLGDDGGDSVDLFSPPLPFPLPPEPIPLRREVAPSRASPALSLEAPAAPLRVMSIRPAPELVAHAEQPEPAPIVEILREAPTPAAPIASAAPVASVAPVASAAPIASVADRDEERAPHGEDDEPAEAAAASAEDQSAHWGARRHLGGAAVQENSGNAVTETADGRVKVGQRYVKVDAGGIAWQVVSIFAGPLGVPHVRIANVEEPDTLRAVSVSTLLERSRYRPVS